MRYVMDRSGIGRMMRSDAGIHRVLLQSANKVKANARSRINNQSGQLANSGRVEDLGVKKVQRGEPRMTVAVVFHSRYAMDHEKRTGFLSGAVGRGRRP